jgi:hypothetical protein
MTMTMLQQLEKRGISIFFLLLSLSIGVLGDIASQGLISDKAAKWAAIIVALLTSLRSALTPQYQDATLDRLRADKTPVSPPMFPPEK